MSTCVLHAHHGPVKCSRLPNKRFTCGPACSSCVQLTLHIPATLQSATLGDWYPILLISTFNVADLVGKNLPLPATATHCSQRALLAWCVARAAFLPAFIAATVLGAHAAVIALLTTALGLSNGYLTALIMTTAPAGVSHGEAEMVEKVVVFSLVLGLTAGAVLGWLWLCC